MRGEARILEYTKSSRWKRKKTRTGKRKEAYTRAMATDEKRQRTESRNIHWYIILLFYVHERERQSAERNMCVRYSVQQYKSVQVREREGGANGTNGVREGTSTFRWYVRAVRRLLAVTATAPCRVIQRWYRVRTRVLASTRDRCATTTMTTTRPK